MTQEEFQEQYSVLLNEKKAIAGKRDAIEEYIQEQSKVVFAKEKAEIADLALRMAELRTKQDAIQAERIATEQADKRASIQVGDVVLYHRNEGGWNGNTSTYKVKVLALNEDRVQVWGDYRYGFNSKPSWVNWKSLSPIRKEVAQ